MWILQSVSLVGVMLSELTGLTMENSAVERHDIVTVHIRPLSSQVERPVPQKIMVNLPLLQHSFTAWACPLYNDVPKNQLRWLDNLFRQSV